MLCLIVYHANASVLNYGFVRKKTPGLDNFGHSSKEKDFSAREFIIFWLWHYQSTTFLRSDTSFRGTWGVSFSGMYEKHNTMSGGNLEHGTGADDALFE